MIHQQQGGLYWIEAQDFATSNFARQATADNEARALMAVPEASMGTLVVGFQRPDDYLEYAFREDVDGVFTYQVWLRYATPCPASRIHLLLDGVEVAVDTLGESGDFFHHYAWRRLGDVEVTKGNHTVRLLLDNGAIHPDVLLLTPDSSPIDSGAAEAAVRESRRDDVQAATEPVTSDRLWLPHDRNGVPLGGIGTGKVELAQDGALVNASINNNQDAPIATMPGSFFVGRETCQDDTNATVRWLDSAHANLPAVETLAYDGWYPFARVEYADRAWQCRVELEAFSPLVPYDPDASATPATLFAFRVRNAGDRRVRFDLGFSWENVLGCGGVGGKPEYGPGTALRVNATSFWAWQDRTGNRQEPVTTGRGCGLVYRGGDGPGYASSQGEYVAVCQDLDGVQTTVTRNYNVETDLPALAEALVNGIPDALCEDAGQEGTCHPAGIVWGSVELAPGQSREIVFCLAWHFPVFLSRWGDDQGVYYTRTFADAAAAADHALAHRESLARRSRAVTDRLRASNLPDWLVRKIVNDQFPMTTCSWFDGQGRFSINESASGMHGCLGTIDQRTCSQAPWTVLFPSLDQNELDTFAATQRDDGRIPHDIGWGAIFRREPGCQWPDLVCSFIAETHRHVLATGKLDWGRRVYDAHIPRAIDWVLGIDDDGDGIPDMRAGRGHTYDTSDWPGCSAFVASLWIAGLEIAADFARLLEYPEDARRYRALAAKAAASMDEKLWNGAYWQNFHAPDSDRKDAVNCVLPQAAGEWCLDLVDVPGVLPADRVVAALREVFRLNIRGKDFKCAADEVRPDGEPAWTGTSFLQYSWIYFGALAAYRGLTAEAEFCWQQAYRQGWEINRRPWKTNLCGFAVSGKFNGLPWYMTNTASWYILHAISGFWYSVPEGWLRLDPHLPATWEAATHLRLPLFGAGWWAHLDWQVLASGVEMTLSPDEVFTTDPPTFEVLRLGVPAAADVTAVTVDGRVLDGWGCPRPGRLDISLPVPWDARGELTVRVTWKE